MDKVKWTLSYCESHIEYTKKKRARALSYGKTYDGVINYLKLVQEEAERDYRMLREFAKDSNLDNGFITMAGISDSLTSVLQDLGAIEPDHGFDVRKLLEIMNTEPVDD